MTNEYFKNQLSIFDIIETEEAPQFPESDFAEIVDYLNYKLGLNFQREKWATEYEREAYSCKVNKRLRFTIARGRFDPDINGGAEYISCGWQTSTAGGGSPIEDTQAAENYFASTIRAYDNGLIE